MVEASLGIPTPHCDVDGGSERLIYDSNPRPSVLSHQSEVVVHHSGTWVSIAISGERMSLEPVEPLGIRSDGLRFC